MLLRQRVCRPGQDRIKTLTKITALIAPDLALDPVTRRLLATN